MRFKCTNKRWYHLLSHPHFAKLHFQRGSKGIADTTTTPKKLLKTNPPQSIDYESFDLSGHRSALVDLEIPFLSSSSIGGSCNGLICLIKEEFLILWNPTTKESRDLLKPTIIPNGSVLYGFRYDSISNDYKILFGINYTNEGGVKNSIAKVFTLKTNSWKRVPCKFAHKISNVYRPTSFVNESIHWLAKYMLKHRKKYQLFLEEKFCETLPSSDIDQGSSFMGLGVHEGCGCLVVNHGGYKWRASFEGLVMREYGVKSSWPKVFKTSHEGLPGCLYWLEPLVWTRKGNIVFNIDAGSLIIYNEEEHTCRRIPIKRNDHKIEVVVYVESLVSPFRDNGRLETPW